MSLSVCPRQSTLTRPKLPESSRSNNYAAHNNNALPSHTASSLLLLLIFLRSIHLACSLYLSPSQVFIYSLHAYCRLSMGIVKALIKGQPILTEFPPTLFLFLLKSSNEKIAKQVFSQLWMAVCGKALKNGFMWVAASVEGECDGLWVN